jgi:type II secretory pathway component PulM
MKYSELSVREKRSLQLGCMALAALLVWQLVVRPVQSRLTSLNRIVDSKEQVLEDTQKMSLDLNRLKIEVKDLETLVNEQPNTGSILAMLEKIQAKNRMDKSVTRMRPSTMLLGQDYEQITISLELAGITFEKLVAFLVDVEAMELVIGVQRILINETKSSAGTLTATIDVATIRFIQTEM